MSLLTAMSGAVTNFVLNLLFIPRMGANGAALATVCAFIVVFITRGANVRKYIKISYKLPLVITETVILAVQSGLMLWLQKGFVLYAVEALLFAVMIAVNYKPIKELVSLIINKFLKRKKS